MEHIVQFGISIDDDYIRRTVENKALEAVMLVITKNIEDSVKPQWGYSRDSGWKEIVKGEAAKFVESHEEEILNAAVKVVAEKIQNSKAYKEACKTVVLARVSQLSDEDIVRLGLEVARDEA